ncbi:putative ABC transport system substrate-binding protein [Bradyrhizobium sp. cir1]|uniref:ABC transporter substrate-binding protein n=1 Tax=Bradyrhizobium sp. cir1 TaxID=1445730 RepID=UPI001606F380|nr:ABC transporter substrate-binding protein [Bradyrhizobium sp. cir1]MBB4372623.1 putative ABC transport system substrate-binding protein [Bradyrhizobium sp. cir1]
MRRREFIGLIGGAAAGLRATAQAASVRSVGILHSASFETSRSYFAAFESGLAEAGFKRDQNVSLEYRLANNDLDRLSHLASELVQRNVDVIFVGANTPAVIAAKAAAGSIPIVFVMGADPVKTGVVPSLAQPGRNITGITGLAGELFSKRLQLLHELVPSARAVAYMVNPANPAFTEIALKTNAELARGLGLQLLVVQARNLDEIEKAFVSLGESKVDALLVGADTAYGALRHQIVALATRHAIPASYPVRDFVEVGGLSSYSTDYVEVYRKCGAYVARVLKGERDLPVQQPTSFKFVLNQKAAKSIGLELPSTLLASADEVIE